MCTPQVPGRDKVMEFEPRFSAKPTSALSCWAISQPPTLLFWFVCEKDQRHQDGRNFALSPRSVSKILVSGTKHFTLVSCTCLSCTWAEILRSMKEAVQHYVERFGHWPLICQLFVFCPVWLRPRLARFWKQKMMLTPWGKGWSSLPRPTRKRSSGFQFKSSFMLVPWAEIV